MSVFEISEATIELNGKTLEIGLRQEGPDVYIYMLNKRREPIDLVTACRAIHALFAHPHTIDAYRWHFRSAYTMGTVEILDQQNSVHISNKLVAYSPLGATLDDYRNNKFEEMKTSRVLELTPPEYPRSFYSSEMQNGERVYFNKEPDMSGQDIRTVFVDPKKFLSMLIQHSPDQVIPPQRAERVWSVRPNNSDNPLPVQRAQCMELGGKLFFGLGFGSVDLQSSLLYSGVKSFPVDVRAEEVDLLLRLCGADTTQNQRNQFGFGR